MAKVTCTLESSLEDSTPFLRPCKLTINMVGIIDPYLHRKMDKYTYLPRLVLRIPVLH
jgi:hypothetical protein